MNEWTLTASGQAVAFFPEIGATVDVRRAVSQFNARDMTGYSYLFQQKEQRSWKIPLKYVNSADRSILEDWFRADVQVTISPGYEAAQYPAVLRGQRFPLDRLTKPYHDQWGGVLDVRQVSPLQPADVLDVALHASVVVADTLVTTTVVDSSAEIAPEPSSWTYQSDKEYSWFQYENNNFYAEARNISSGNNILDVSCDNGATWSTIIASMSMTDFLVEGDNALGAWGGEAYVMVSGISSTTQTWTYFSDSYGHTYSNPLYRHSSGSLMAFSPDLVSVLYDLPWGKRLVIADQDGTEWTSAPTWITHFSDRVLGGWYGFLAYARGSSPDAGYREVSSSNNPLKWWLNDSNNGINGIAEDGHGRVVIVTNYQVLVSTDGGMTWEVSVGTPDGYQPTQVQYHAGRFVVLLGDTGSELLHSTSAASGDWTAVDITDAGLYFRSRRMQFNTGSGDILLGGSNTLTGSSQLWWSGS